MSGLILLMLENRILDGHGITFKISTQMRECFTQGNEYNIYSLITDNDIKIKYL